MPILILLVLAAQDPPPAENLILVTLDGIRWEEVFRGADEKLINKKDGGVEDADALKKAFWRDTPQARRETLLPFLWSVIAREGQILGNGDRGSVARVSNGLNFSYPGYGELLSGFPDPRIDSNKKIPNPNVTVLEWLNGRPGFQGRVAAFCTWDVFPSILNPERSKLPVNIGEPPADAPLTERQKLLAELTGDLPAVHKGSVLDALSAHLALEHLKKHRPRVLYLALGETDEWAHSGRYDRTLEAIRRCDRFVRALWETAQEMPSHRGKTALLVTTDHGRGGAPAGWKSHGEKVKGAERIWIAILGPGVAPLGDRADTPEILQAQVAATASSLVGENYRAAVPKAAPPLPLKGPP